MTNLQIYNKPKSDKKYKLGKAICTAGIVMALLPVPALASELEVTEKNQIEITSDVNLRLNPFYEPTEEDLTFDMTALQKYEGSYFEIQKEISFEEYQEILANSEDTVIFAENGKVFEIDKQEFQNAVEKEIDSYNQSDKEFALRMMLASSELAIVTVICAGIAKLRLIVRDIHETQKTKRLTN